MDESGWTTSRKNNWVRVTAWQKLAEQLSQYLTKGSKVLVVGEVEDPNAYIDKEGKPRASLEVKANVIRFLTPKGEAAAMGTASSGGTAPTTVTKRTTKTYLSKPTVYSCGRRACGNARLFLCAQFPPLSALLYNPHQEHAFLAAHMPPIRTKPWCSHCWILSKLIRGEMTTLNALRDATLCEPFVDTRLRQRYPRHSSPRLDGRRRPACPGTRRG